MLAGQQVPVELRNRLRNRACGHIGYTVRHGRPHLPQRPDGCRMDGAAVVVGRLRREDYAAPAIDDEHLCDLLLAGTVGIGVRVRLCTLATD